MRYFKFIWNNGRIDYKKGHNFHEAYYHMGKSMGDIRELKSFTEISEEDYVENTRTKKQEG